MHVANSASTVSTNGLVRTRSACTLRSKQNDLSGPVSLRERERGDQPPGAPAGGAQPCAAARGAALGRHADRPALPPHPLRHPRGRPGHVAARGRRARRAPALAVARRPPRASVRRARRDDGVRRQRPRAHRAARREPTVAPRGSRYGSLARSPGRGAARRGGRARTARRTRCSPASTAVSRAGRSRSTSGAFRSTCCSAATRCSRTRSTACPCRRSTAFPLRLVVPGWYGMTSVKWLARITLVDEPFDGYQMRHSYRVRYDEDEAGEPITTIAPRSLMIPPGIPEFTQSRARGRGGSVRRSTGRAWSGCRRDRGGRRLGGRRRRRGRPPSSATRRLGRWAWRSWRFTWDRRARRARALLPRARRGRQRAAARAAWNVGGYVNNAVQRVSVTVAG